MVLSGSDLELYRVIMRCGELVGGEAEMIRRVLEDAVAEAVDHAPSLIILDDLDGLIPGGSEGPEPATTVVALAEFLGDLMDLYQGGGQKDNGRPAIVFLAIARSPNALPSSLCLSGTSFFCFFVPVLFWLGCHHNIYLATKILPWTLEKSFITFKNRTQSYQLQTNSWLFAWRNK
jgi:hypothetical protein